MTRESKLFTAVSKSDVSNKIKDYESFGWELLSVYGNDVSMSRNTQNPSYVHLVKYENEYENINEQIKLSKIELSKLSYTPITPILMLILTIMLIFPGVLYYLYKKKQKEEYLQRKSQLEAKISQLEADKIKIVNDSRATFFAQRS